MHSHSVLPRIVLILCVYFVCYDFHIVVYTINGSINENVISELNHGYPFEQQNRDF